MAYSEHVQDEHLGGHVLPTRLYVTIFLALFVLTGLTVAAAAVNFGGFWNEVIALGIATVKALLVILFFMHVRYYAPTLRMVAAAGFVFFGILITFTMSDFLSRDWGQGTVSQFAFASTPPAIEVPDVPTSAPNATQAIRAVSTGQAGGNDGRGGTEAGGGSTPGAGVTQPAGAATSTGQQTGTGPAVGRPVAGVPRPAGPGAAATGGTGGTPAAGGGQQNAQAVTVDIAANNIQFDKNRIEVPAGAQVTVRLTNQEQAPHNWAAYESAQNLAQPIVRGPVFSGPNQTKNTTFTAPSQPGTYYFQCDVHPNMNGQLVVR